MRGRGEGALMVTQGNIRGDQQGVTLVELMVGALVAAIIIAAGLYLMHRERIRFNRKFASAKGP